MVSGQTARFECIVQCENVPEIVWMKDGRQMMYNPPKHLIEYRNGVCRLTISQTTTGELLKGQSLPTGHLKNIFLSFSLQPTAVFIPVQHPTTWEASQQRRACWCRQINGVPVDPPTESWLRVKCRSAAVNGDTNAK